MSSTKSLRTCLRSFPEETVYHVNHMQEKKVPFCYKHVPVAHKHQFSNGLFGFSVTRKFISHTSYFKDELNTYVLVRKFAVFQKDISEMVIAIRILPYN